MSHYPNNANPYDPYAAGMPPKTSGLAITSLVFSLCGLVTCGLASIIGVILGLIGVITLGPASGKRGRGLAAAGLIVGLLVTPLCGGLTFVFVKYIYDTAAYVQTGPHDALTAGMNGDIQGFKASFRGAGASTPDAEAQAFLNELNKRYGVLSAVEPAGGQARAQPGQPSVPLPYTLTFSGGSVEATIELHFANTQTGSFTDRALGYIHIHDVDKGDLWYPASADPMSGGATTAPSTSEEDGEAPETEPETAGESAGTP